MKDIIEEGIESVKDKPDIEGGDVLVSTPLLRDPNFSRSVLLILQKEGSGGHFGLVINRPLDISLRKLCGMPGVGKKMKAYSGGPVDTQRMFWIHTLGDRLSGSIEVLPGLYVGGNYDDLIQAFIKGEELEGKIRFFLGYAGWVEGQLAKEIELGAWGVLKRTSILDPQMLIESEGEEMWQTLVRRLGSDYRHWLILPADPGMN